MKKQVGLPVAFFADRKRQLVWHLQLLNGDQNQSTSRSNNKRVSPSAKVSVSRGGDRLSEPAGLIQQDVSPVKLSSPDPICGSCGGSQRCTQIQTIAGKNVGWVLIVIHNKISAVAEHKVKGERVFFVRKCSRNPTEYN